MWVSVNVLRSSEGLKLKFETTGGSHILLCRVVQCVFLVDVLKWQRKNNLVGTMHVLLIMCCVSFGCWVFVRVLINSEGHTLGYETSLSNFETVC